MLPLPESGGFGWRGWRQLMRPGDWLTLLGGVILLLALIWLSWHQDAAARVRMFQNGKLLGEYDLNVPRQIEAQGPLGITLIEISGGRARIARDPSPRQYCVKSGWLEAAGQVAICLPNRTSIELVNREKPLYDSLTY